MVDARYGHRVINNGSKLALYKVLRGKRSPHTNHNWPQPINNGTPGLWVTIPENETLSLCHRGLHVYNLRQVKKSLYVTRSPRAFKVFRAEAIGEGVADKSKYAFRTVRLKYQVAYGSDEWNRLFKGTHLFVQR